MTDVVKQEHSLGGTTPNLILGLDGLRFFAALWVVFYHGAHFPMKELIGTQFGIFGTALIGVNALLFTGATAVVAFFLISGLCIHYPNVGKASLDWKTFLARRMVRIGTPLLAIILIVNLLGVPYPHSENAVLWTIYCEIIYYLLYPLLFWVLQKIKIAHVLMISCLISAGLLLLFPSYTYLFDYGIIGTWLFCAPAWLAGAALAEVFKGKKLPKLPGSVWLWRGGLIFYGMILGFFVGHAGRFSIGLPWMSIPAVIIGYFWLIRELQSYRTSRIRQVFEILGLASYSLYLVHKIPLTALAPYKNAFHPLIYWVFCLAAVAICCALFYFAVERPAHKWAKSIKFNSRHSKA